MKRILTGIVLLGVSCLHAFGAEPAVESRIDSVSLFKNGLAVVKQTVQMPTNGTYRIEDVPEPVHGTFWIEGDANVEARVTTQEVEVPLRTKGWVDFQDELAGHAVTLYFRDGNIPPVDGTVVKIEASEGMTWNRTYQQQQYYYGSRLDQQPQGRFLVLETSRRRIYVDSSMIAYADVKNATDSVLERRPVLLLTVTGATNTPSTASISYLTKGLSWAPSYRVDITDPQELQIEQKAVIKNELGDIEEAELFLISGFPNIEFAHVTSPLSPSTSWAGFFQQLNQRFQPGSAVATQQRIAPVALNAAAPDAGLDLSAMPTGEGPDVHYQSIGSRSLQEGDSLSLPVASGTTDYERIVEWIVPDTRRADGRYIEDYQRRQDPEKYEDAAWDAIRFDNPLPFPMTTGPAMIVANGRFQGEQTSFWVNSGEETTLHITKALSIRTRAVEHENPGEREIVYIAGDDFQKTTVTGELTASNHRNEAVTLVIRRRFSGDLLTADGEPECSLLEEGAWSVNKRNELNWTLTLDAGEEKTLTYSYSLLVNR